MLELMREGQVYEFFLVLKFNVIFVGVVRRGVMFYFKFFFGKSFRDLLENNWIVFQMIWDVEFFVKIVFNFDVEFFFEFYDQY